VQKLKSELKYFSLVQIKACREQKQHLHPFGNTLAVAEADIVSPRSGCYFRWHCGSQSNQQKQQLISAGFSARWPSKIFLHDQACVPVGTIEESTRSPKIKLMNHTFEA
jgi:hypothetical protein